MKLRELRNLAGLTQNDLASKLNVSGQTILNWENGIYEPKISQLIELADLFDVSVDYLVDRPKRKNKVNEIIQELRKIEADQLLKFIENCLNDLKD